jgi:hypothetical protein
LRTHHHLESKHVTRELQCPILCQCVVPPCVNPGPRGIYAPMVANSNSDVLVSRRTLCRPVSSNVAPTARPCLLDGPSEPTVARRSLGTKVGSMRIYLALKFRGRFRHNGNRRISLVGPLDLPQHHSRIIDDDGNADALRDVWNGEVTAELMLCSRSATVPDDEIYCGELTTSEKGAPEGRNLFFANLQRVSAVRQKSVDLITAWRTKVARECRNCDSQSLVGRKQTG